MTGQQIVAYAAIVYMVFGYFKPLIDSLTARSSPGTRDLVTRTVVVAIGVAVGLASLYLQAVSPSAQEIKGAIVDGAKIGAGAIAVYHLAPGGALSTTLAAVLDALSRLSTPTEAAAALSQLAGDLNGTPTPPPPPPAAPATPAPPPPGSPMKDPALLMDVHQPAALAGGQPTLVSAPRVGAAAGEEPVIVAPRVGAADASAGTAGEPV